MIEVLKSEVPNSAMKTHIKTLVSICVKVATELATPPTHDFFDRFLACACFRQDRSTS